jgi:hypothetical protein
MEDGMKTLTTLMCLAALLLAVDARAQQFDAAAQLGLLNRNRADLGSYDNWYSAAAIDGTFGRYWSPHVKTEFDMGTSGEGSIWAPYREYKVRDTTIGAAVLYQFFDNQWVHPFAGGGVEFVHERERTDAFPPPTFRGVTSAGFPVVPSLPAIDSVSYSVRPIVTGGFKFYVTHTRSSALTLAPRSQRSGRWRCSGAAASASISEEVGRERRCTLRPRRAAHGRRRGAGFGTGDR